MKRHHLRNLLILAFLAGMFWWLPWLPDQDEVIFPKAGLLLPGQTLEAQEEMTLRLKDGHFLTLSPGSKVTLKSHRRALFGPRREQTLRVEKGRVYLSGQGDRDAFLRLETPYSAAGVRGTSLALSVQPGISAHSVHEGQVTEGGVPLKVGQGRLSSQPGQIQSLPSSPFLLGPASEQEIREPNWIVWRGKAWGYRLELARDPQFQEILWSAVVRGNQAAIPALPQDTPMWVRLFSLTPDGLESLPSFSAHFDYRLHHQQAVQWLRRGQPMQALEQLEKSRDFFPKDSRLLRDEGWARYLQGDHPLAAKLLQASLAESPNDWETRSKLARVLFWLKRYPESEALYLQLIANQPADADQHWGLAEVYRAQALFTKAEKEAEIAMRIDPFHPYAPLTLAESVRAKQPARARQILLRFLDLREPQGDLFLLARRKAYGTNR